MSIDSEDQRIRNMRLYLGESVDEVDNLFQEPTTPMPDESELERAELERQILEMQSRQHGYQEEDNYDEDADSLWFSDLRAFPTALEEEETERMVVDDPVSIRISNDDANTVDISNSPISIGSDVWSSIQPISSFSGGNSYTFKTITIKNKETEEMAKINVNNFDEVIEYIYKVKAENIIVRTEMIETNNFYDSGNLSLEKEKEIVQSILNVLNKKERKSIGSMARLDRD